MRQPSFPRRLAGPAVAATAFLVGVVALVASGFAAEPVTRVSTLRAAAVAPAANPFERGPAPSTASISAATGPFSITTTRVARGNGFGGGTIYAPTTAQTTFGAVAIAPGFTARQSSIAWMGPRLASQGFVVFTIDTLTTSDRPAARGDQLLAALRFLTTSSPARTKVDPGRLAVMGHSMGGGGTLEAAADNTALKAAIPLTGWDTKKSFAGVRTPTLVIGAQRDTVASPRSHSIPFFNGLTNASEKAYLELQGASHFTPNSPNTAIAANSIAWLKRFVDNDTRFSPFICPGPVGNGFSTARASCPV